MYFYSGKGQRAEMHGRGLSLGDAFELFGFVLPKTIPDMQSHIYKPCVLRFKRIDGDAVAVLQYEGESEERLCYAFQIRFSDGKYVDLNVDVLSRALTYISRGYNDEQ